jgi:hypothetical protein
MADRNDRGKFPVRDRRRLRRSRAVMQYHRHVSSLPPCSPPGVILSRSLALLMAAAASAILPNLRAQDVSAGVSFTASANSANGQWSELPPLDQLLAPVALYPDPLLGLVLPASTQPGDLQAAAAGQSSSSDPAVQGLMHYPDVLRWMTSN